MAKKINENNQEIYGGNPAVYEDALENMKNNRKLLKDRLKPVEKATKELEKSTATEAARLKTEGVDVKNRAELSKLIEQTKKRNAKFKVERSLREGFRYKFFTEGVKEDEEEKPEDFEEPVELELDTFDGDDMVELDPEMGFDLEEEPELTALDVLETYLTFEETKDNKVVIKLQGDEKKGASITLPELSDKEQEAMFVLLHGEEDFEDEEDQEEVSLTETKEEPKLGASTEFGKEIVSLNDFARYAEFFEGQNLIPLLKAVGAGAVKVYVKDTGNLVTLNVVRHGKVVDVLHGEKRVTEDLDLASDRGFGKEITSEEEAKEVSEETPWDIGEHYNTYKDAGFKFYVNISGGDKVLTYVNQDGFVSKAFNSKGELVNPEQAGGFAASPQAGAEEELKNTTEKELLLDKEEVLGDEEPQKLEEEAKIISELNKFEPWAGAVSIWAKIVEQNKVEELDVLLEDIYPEGISSNELNDLLWFEEDWLFDMLGLVDEEDFERDEDESEEDYEERDDEKVYDEPEESDLSLEWDDGEPIPLDSWDEE